MQYITRLDNLQDNIPYKCTYNNLPVVIYKTKKGIYALEDICSHENFPLSESNSDDEKVECKLHGSVFELATGKPVNLPAVTKVKTYKVTLEDNKIFISESEDN